MARTSSTSKGSGNGKSSSSSSKPKNTSSSSSSSSKPKTTKIISSKGQTLGNIMHDHASSQARIQPRGGLQSAATLNAAVNARDSAQRLKNTLTKAGYTGT